jgi:Tfp pilus assembly protein PilF
MQSRRFDAAEKAYEHAFASGQSNLGAVKLHAASVAAGRAREADVRLLAWIQAHPQDLAARSYLAEQYMKRGEHAKAIQQYETVASQSPDEVRTLNNLAVLYQATGDRRALTLAERAVKLAPNAAPIIDTLGWILVDQGRVVEGLPYLRKAIELDPEFPEFRYHLGVALAKSGDKAGARQELNRALNGKTPLAQAAEAKSWLGKL